MDEAHILVVDDDTRLRDLLARYLSHEGFRVTMADSARAARGRLRALAFDLIVMDVMMPGETGMDLTRSLRADSDVPILMLTAMGEAEARIEGLEAGADDYLAKPFEPRELILRVNAILRRRAPGPAPAAPGPVRLGGLSFDPDRRVLTRAGGGGPVRLTGTEAALLARLASAPGQVLNRLALSEAARIEGGDRAVDVQVTRLRRKIEPDAKAPRYLQTVRGQGYVLWPD